MKASNFLNAESWTTSLVASLEKSVVHWMKVLLLEVTFRKEMVWTIDVTATGGSQPTTYIYWICRFWSFIYSIQHYFIQHHTHLKCKRFANWRYFYNLNDPRLSIEKLDFNISTQFSRTIAWFQYSFLYDTPPLKSSRWNMFPNLLVWT